MAPPLNGPRSNEIISVLKVREHSLAYVPNLLVHGKREAEGRTAALRVPGSGGGQKVSGLEALMERLSHEAAAPDPA
jgi:threonyl-tRNA synthetase